MTRIHGIQTDDEKWVTIYGFSPENRSLVTEEFEKCGAILMGFVGPRDSNWMHIRYESRIEAQEALSKNGMQLNRELIIGVKPMDPMELQAIRDEVDRVQSMISPQPITEDNLTSQSDNTNTFQSGEIIASIDESLSLQTSQSGGIIASIDESVSFQTSQSGEIIASIDESLRSKLVDFVFGL